MRLILCAQSFFVGRRQCRWRPSKSSKEPSPSSNVVRDLDALNGWCFTSSAIASCSTQNLRGAPRLRDAINAEHPFSSSRCQPICSAPLAYRFISKKLNRCPTADSTSRRSPRKGSGPRYRSWRFYPTTVDRIGLTLPLEPIGKLQSLKPIAGLRGRKKIFNESHSCIQKCPNPGWR